MVWIETFSMQSLNNIDIDETMSQHTIKMLTNYLEKRIYVKRSSSTKIHMNINFTLTSKLSIGVFFRNEISIISFIFKVSAFYTSCNLISVPLMKFEGTLNQIVILNIVNCVLFRMFINVIIFFLF